MLFLKCYISVMYFSFMNSDPKSQFIQGRRLSKAWRPYKHPSLRSSWPKPFYAAYLQKILGQKAIGLYVLLLITFCTEMCQELQV